MRGGPHLTGQHVFVIRPEGVRVYPRLETVVECIRFLLGPQARGLTGKTISANFDPWRSEEFGAHVDDLVQSDVWTMRRINVVNLEDGPLKAALAEALARRTVGVGG